MITQKINILFFSRHGRITRYILVDINPQNS